MSALHEALSKAIADCGEGVAKDRAAQGYKFRGIDQMLNFLNPIMARHQLALVPHHVFDEQVIERQTKSGGAMYFARAKVEFRLRHACGDALQVMVWSEASDVSDKALNKVMSVAWKYAAIQTFCIPVEDVADENPTNPDMEPSPYIGRGPLREHNHGEPPKNPAPPPLLSVKFIGRGPWSGKPVRDAPESYTATYLAQLAEMIQGVPESKRPGFQAHLADVERVYNEMQAEQADRALNPPPANHRETAEDDIPF